MSDLSHCARLVRRFDNDRFLCALFAPEAAREALFALYAFDYEIARIPERVREPMAGRIRLQWWRDAVTGMFGGRRPDHPVGGPLAEAVRGLALTPGPFETYFDARETDLDETAPASLAALEEYAEATAGSLALLAAEALGVRDGDTAAAARDVGAAWGLAGALRAAPYHAAQGRGEPAAAPEEVAQAARRRLAAARALRPQVPRAALPALMPALLADGHLVRLERAGWDALRSRAEGGAWRIIRLLGRGAFLGRW